MSAEVDPRANNLFLREEDIGGTLHLDAPQSLGMQGINFQQSPDTDVDDDHDHGPQTYNPRRQRRVGMPKSPSRRKPRSKKRSHSPQRKQGSQSRRQSTGSSIPDTLIALCANEAKITTEPRSLPLEEQRREESISNNDFGSAFGVVPGGPRIPDPGEIIRQVQQDRQFDLAAVPEERQSQVSRKSRKSRDERHGRKTRKSRSRKSRASRRSKSSRGSRPSKGSRSQRSHRSKSSQGSRPSTHSRSSRGSRGSRGSRDSRRSAASDRSRKTGESRRSIDPGQMAEEMQRRGPQGKYNPNRVPLRAPPGRKQSPVERKLDLLYKLYNLQQSGYEPSRAYSMHDSLDDMEVELQSLCMRRAADKSIHFSRSVLMISVQGLEWMNEMWDDSPFYLHNWSKAVMSRITDYDDAFERIYERGRMRGPPSPYIEIMLTLTASAALYHVRAQASGKSNHNKKKKAGESQDMGDGAGGGDQLSGLMSAITGGAGGAGDLNLPKMVDALSSNPQLIQQIMNAMGVQNLDGVMPTVTPSAPQYQQQQAQQVPQQAPQPPAGPKFDQEFNRLQNILRQPETPNDQIPSNNMRRPSSNLFMNAMGVMGGMNPDKGFGPRPSNWQPPGGDSRGDPLSSHFEQMLPMMNPPKESLRESLRESGRETARESERRRRESTPYPIQDPESDIASLASLASMETTDSVPFQTSGRSGRSSPQHKAVIRENTLYLDIPSE